MSFEISMTFIFLQFNFTVAENFRSASMIVQIKNYGITNLCRYEELLVPFPPKTAVKFIIFFRINSHSHKHIQVETLKYLSLHNTLLVVSLFYRFSKIIIWNYCLAFITKEFLLWVKVHNVSQYQNRHTREIENPY